MKEVAIKVKNIKDVEVFIEKCKKLGYNFLEDGDTDYDYLYFNISAGEDFDILEGEFWYTDLYSDKEDFIVKTEEEVLKILGKGILSTPLKLVKEFHEAFGVENNEEPVLIPDSELRFNLAQEELDEYKEAYEENDLTEILDSLVDQAYILYGTILRHGLQNVFEKAFKEVHSSNMSKLGEDGKPIYREDGKIMKGKNFFKPNLKQFLKND